MPSYHIDISAPTKSEGSALEHSQYIQREGRFTEERYGEVVARGQANFPEWAREDTSVFWKASDEFERANGSVYREYEMALPRELSRAAQIELVERFAVQEFGSTRAYQWAIHEPMASDGKPQPHVHLMFSDRQHDGIERGPEQTFKRYNSKHPERGGCRKMSYGATKAEAALTYEAIRERWGRVQNQALELAGVEARVDHRSLAAQGITDREPGVHRGPAVSGIEARGEVSEVGLRQREQRLERVQTRELVVADVRVVSREELALERVAVRERRELAQAVTGDDREEVLKRVEVDRREQIARAHAMAERRVERRQGLGVGERLVTQARALRERIGEQLGRVKEWVLERFPDPVRQIKERVRGIFEGLKLEAGLSERGGERPAVPTPAAERKPELGSRRAVMAVSLDRYAQAWMDAERMVAKGLPVLPHQATAIAKAEAALEAQRPGFTRDLKAAIAYEPAVRQAMRLQGPERVAALLTGLQHEERIRRDPALRVARLVKEWNGLEGRRQASREWERPEEHAKLKEQMTELTRELKRDPQLESLARQRGRELGIERGSPLDQVIRSRTLERGIEITLDLGRGHGLSL